MNDDLIFTNVSFKYENWNENSLQSINLTIPKGKITAIIGSSGSGKTTLVKLIEWFYDPSEGTVLLGPHDLKVLNLKSYRKCIGYVG